MISITGVKSKHDELDGAVGRERITTAAVAVLDERTDTFGTLEISAATGACGTQIVIGIYSMSYGEARALASHLAEAIAALENGASA